MLLIKGSYFKGMDFEVVLLNLLPLTGISIIVLLIARYSFKIKTR
jgi:hypothetical protein